MSPDYSRVLDCLHIGDLHGAVTALQDVVSLTNGQAEAIIHNVYMVQPSEWYLQLDMEVLAVMNSTQEKAADPVLNALLTLIDLTKETNELLKDLIDQ